MSKDKPYSEQDYIEAELLGYDLDDWNDYCEYYELESSEQEEAEAVALLVNGIVVEVTND